MSVTDFHVWTMSSIYFLRIFVFLGLSCGVTGYLDLYLSTKETLRLLGVQYELYYVRNGIINQYALSFEMPLQSHIDALYFSWQSLREEPEMSYTMSFNVSNPRVMVTPSSNISLMGTVPNKLSVFGVSLPCTGSINAEVHINIQLTISILSASEPTVLNFRRKKVCLKKNSVWMPSSKGNGTGQGGNAGQQPPGRDLVPGQNNDKTSWLPNFKLHDNMTVILQEAFNPSLSSALSPGSGTTKPPDDEDSSSSTHIFYAAVACTCAVIILVALAVAGFYLNSNRTPTDRYGKKMNSYTANDLSRSDSSSSQALTAQSQTFLRPDTPNNVSGAAGIPAGFRRGISPAVDLKPTDVKTVLSEILIDRKRISFGDLLLEGTFGRIYTGTLIGEDENEAEGEQEIYIKTVTDQARPDQSQLFLSESILLKGLVHANIHAILGACLENTDQPLVLYPSCLEGNMKKFLLKCRMSECGSKYTLNTQQLVYMAIQMVRGVQYLHRKKLIHKDLATRNFMVDGDFLVKVSDNALSRDLFPGDYNCLGDNENRPIKWMALEALQDKRFSPASDVWSLGVTLWEMMTLGQMPYAEVDPFEMVSYLQEGYRIAKPHNCPDELFSLMACCWALAPDERPKLGQLLMYLQNFYMALGRYV